MSEVELTEAEREHLTAFTLSRPGWLIGTLAERIKDELECDSNRTHKYPAPHPYITGMQYVLKRILPCAPCRVLDIGSPLQQNIALAAMPGVELTMVDIRPHADSEKLGLQFKVGNATALPFEDGSWPIVTCLWVMGHVGDGRYGDVLDHDGDIKCVSEIARVLEPGGTAIIGPGLIAERCSNLFNLHRTYTWEWLLPLFDRLGLDVLEHEDLTVEDEVFTDVIDEKHVKTHRRHGFYGIATLRKR